MVSVVKVGTSGYSYSWNKGVPSPFEWYVQQGFSTVEINASFYRFPVESWVKAWLRCPEDFDFSIKVHRSVTHYTKFRGKAINLWERFRKPLRGLQHRMTFWLFQAPPSFSYNEKNVSALESFFSKANLGESAKAVIEFRHASWWRHKDVCREMDTGFCSVDAPGLPRDIVAVADVVYLRLHGREEWYSYLYSEKELRDIARRLKRLRASRKHIYLNNNHGMLPNGMRLMELLGKAARHRAAPGAQL